MTRSSLLRTLSAASLAAAHFATAHAATVINSGGGTSPEYDYLSEYNTYNASQSLYSLTSYAAVGSSSGQSAFLGNSSTYLYGAGTPAVTVHFASSDALLSVSQITAWLTASTGQSSAANLIQIPAAGTGEAIVVRNTAFKKNGFASFDDAQVCGVFSGKITDFSDPSLPPGLTAGPIRVDYRSDGAGTTFILSGHLAAVCNSTNSSFPLATTTSSGFSATKTFTALVTGGTVPANFFGFSGNAGVGADLEASSSAIGYVSPDYTTVITTSQALINGAKSTLLAAKIVGPDGKGYLPDAKDVKNGLLHPNNAYASHTGAITAPTSTQTITGSTTQAANDPESWVPEIPVVTKGYPIIGYSTLELPQCYAVEAVATGVLNYLSLHYSNATYQAIQNANGLIPVTSSKLNKVSSFILNQVLNNKPVSGVTWNYNINNSATCKAAGGTGTVIGR